MYFLTCAKSCRGWLPAAAQLQCRLPWSLSGAWPPGCQRLSSPAQLAHAGMLAGQLSGQSEMSTARRPCTGDSSTAGHSSIRWQPRARCWQCRQTRVLRRGGPEGDAPLLNELLDMFSPDQGGQAAASSSAAPEHEPVTYEDPDDPEHGYGPKRPNAPQVHALWLRLGAPLGRLRSA